MTARTHRTHMTNRTQRTERAARTHRTLRGRLRDGQASWRAWAVGFATARPGVGRRLRPVCPVRPVCPLRPFPSERKGFPNA